jgi:hypothetical protein
MKPHIRYHRNVYLFGVKFAPNWSCETKYAVGHGSTPKEAFERCIADTPKSAVGRWMRRASNMFLDRFVGG